MVKEILNTIKTIMIDFLIEKMETILSFIVGCITGGICIHFFEMKDCNNTHTTLKNINAGGDVAGRDIKK